MPPKKQQGNKKNDEKVKKIVEDKTFGLKNKNKSAKVQRYVEEVKKVASGGNKKREADIQGPSKKELAAQKAVELSTLFNPLGAQQKVPFGVDPKSILCANFRAGICVKGNKCKFSHDLDIGRKTSKIDLYTDQRNAKENDLIENWDQKKLETVILSKHGNPRTTTNIVCKHFLEAIENSKYGWLWTCPNGGDSCMYKHALPPGYVLKEKKTLKEEEQTISLEEFLETERHKLGSDLTPVTAESFAEWKKRRLEAAAKAEIEATKIKEKTAKSGKKTGLSGRDLYTFNPDLIPEDSNDQSGIDLSELILQKKQIDDDAEQKAQIQAAQELARLNNSESIDEAIFSQIEKFDL